MLMLVRYGTEATSLLQSMVTLASYTFSSGSCKMSTLQVLLTVYIFVCMVMFPLFFTNPLLLGLYRGQTCSLELC